MQETITLQIPKQFASAILAMVTSGAFCIKGDKVVLHFDNGSNLKIIELPPKKIFIENI